MGEELENVPFEMGYYEKLLEENYDEEGNFIDGCEIPTRKKVINSKDIAIKWLYHKLRLWKKYNKDDEPIELKDFEYLARNASRYYIVFCKEKKSGGARIISIPKKILKRVQRRINRKCLIDLPVSKSAFGFSGGNTAQALRAHVESKTILSVDCKDAFPSVVRSFVFDFLAGKRSLRVDKKNGGWIPSGYFSWNVASFISDLVVFKGQLPQGAPTSSKLFDLIFKEIDEELETLAKAVSGKYSRYADNIFFSINDEIFPKELKEKIKEIITNGKFREGGPKFELHKLHIRNTERRVVSALGLNIIDGKIYNTRKFKLKIRKTIHHIFYLIYNDKDYDDAWTMLKGMMNYANKETLPPKIIEQYEILREALY